jgi:hypothetical protein
MGLPITAGCDTAWIQTRVSVVMRLALRCSALDHCATREQMVAEGECCLPDDAAYHFAQGRCWCDQGVRLTLSAVGKNDLPG